MPLKIDHGLMGPKTPEWISLHRLYIRYRGQFSNGADSRNLLPSLSYLLLRRLTTTTAAPKPRPNKEPYSFLKQDPAEICQSLWVKSSLHHPLPHSQSQTSPASSPNSTSESSPPALMS
ncbi:hypothetical protein SLE2022_387350 [Rubroshorea leprosula]